MRYSIIIGRVIYFDEPVFEGYVDGFFSHKLEMAKTFSTIKEARAFIKEHKMNAKVYVVYHETLLTITEAL